MSSFVSDIRYGIRNLIKRPGFTAVAVATLALGIGANSAIFTVVNAVLLRPLPFNHPEQLVTVWETNLKQGQDHGVTGGANFTDWKQRNQVFESLAGYFNWNFNLTGADEPRRLRGLLVSGEFFQTFGVEAAVGRVLLPEDDREGSDDRIVISHGVWQSAFGGRPNVVGQTVLVNGRSHIIVGVMPSTFKFPDETVEMWRPMAMSPENAQNRQGKWISVIGRLKPGVSIEQAQGAMGAVARQLEQQYPESNTGSGVHLIPLHQEIVGKVSNFLFILLGAVGFVLLIACANIASLMLARSSSRRNEVAVRAALGATRGRLVRQFLTEGLLLAVLGGLFGLLIAFWGTDLMVKFSPGNIPRLAEAGVDGRVLGFTFLLSLLTTVLFGLAPAWQVSKTDFNETLKEEGRSASRSSGHTLRGVLVIAEVAVSVVLLVGAGLMVKSLVQLNRVDTGFDPHNLLTMEVTLPASKYSQNEQQIAFFKQALDRIKTLPGVEAVGAVQDLPLRFNTNTFPISIPGRSESSFAQRPQAIYRAVTDDYFRALGIPLIKGRTFTAQDDQKAAPVIAINQAMALRYWPNEDPLGKQIRFGEPTDPTYTIVGVVGDIKHMGLTADEGAVMYQPHAQKRFPWLRWMTLTVRTNVEPLSLTAAVTHQIQEIDKDQPVYNIATMEELLARSTAQSRFSTVLLGSFAVLALILTSIGIYGVVSYAVAQRTREIGIRMALGALSLDILKLVLRNGMYLAVLGAVIGLGGAFAITRFMSSLLFGVSPTDVVTFALVTAGLLLVALVACFLPARRATKVDPLVALRYE